VQRKFFTFVLVSVLSSAFFLGCTNAPAARTETISISGAFALYPMAIRWSEEYRKLNSGVKIDISAGGAGKGMTDVLSGAVDIGMVSREIHPEETKKGALAFGVTKDAVVPVVNARNPFLSALLQRGVKKAEFKKLWIEQSIKTWGRLLGTPDTKTLNVYTRSDSCGAAESWAKYLGGRQDDLKGTGIYGDPGILEAVVKDALGIGYNNFGFAFDPATGRPFGGIAVVPIDINENGKADAEEILDTREKIMKAVETGFYPHPPARPLYMVTKGDPSGKAKDFLRWVLTDGQKFIPEAGYVALPKSFIETEVKKLH